MVDTVGLTDAVSGAPSYSGRKLRQLNAVGFAGATSARPLGARSGVRPGTPSTTVTASSTTWTCQPFAGLLDGQTAAEAGPYPFSFDAVATGAVTAANASNPRIDIVYVQVDDPSEDASSVPAATRKYLAGTAAAVPAAPATPAGCMAIAQINVPKVGSGSPTVTWVAPYLAAAGGVVHFRNAAERDAETTLPPGTLGEVSGLLYVWDGSDWTEVAPPFVSLAKTANQTLTTASTVYAVTWDDVLSDNADMHSAGASSRITAPKAGVYEVAMAFYINAGSGVSTIYARKNGSTAVDRSAHRATGTAGTGTPLARTFPVVLSAGDYLEIMALCTVAGQQVGGGVSEFSSAVTVKYLGPT